VARGSQPGRVVLVILSGVADEIADPSRGKENGAETGFLSFFHMVGDFAFFPGMQFCAVERAGGGRPFGLR
jgi:hypothetical protein